MDENKEQQSYPYPYPLNSKITLHEQTHTLLGGREGGKSRDRSEIYGRQDEKPSRPGGHKVKEREIIPAQRGQQQLSELVVLAVGQHRVAEIARSGSGSG